MPAQAPHDRTVILIPMYNDWEAAELLLDDLDRTLVDRPIRAEVLFIDDGSTQPMPPGFAARQFTALQRVDVLRLLRNLGHQRAIAVGFVYVHQNVPCRAVVVMDGDGEDRPADILQLEARFKLEGERSIIFAARAKRLERLTFRFLYQVYRLLHLLITGARVRVGNFSMVPYRDLARLVTIPEIWNHYAAAVMRSGLGSQSIPIARGKRLVGESKMNFIGLLLHGLSAFFVYGEIIGARLLVAIAWMLVLGVGLVGAAVIVHFTTTVNIASPLPYVAGFIGIILLQAVLVALILVFTVIGSRVNIGFLPVRDCGHFIGGVERVFPHGPRI